MMCRAIHIINNSGMEYEIYQYCTGIGTLILVLIILYHMIGDEAKHEHNEGNKVAS